MRGTKCVGQTIFSVMVPLSRTNAKTIADKPTGTSDRAPFPLSKYMFYILFCVFVHYAKRNGIRRGECTNIRKDAWNIRVPLPVAKCVFHVLMV